MGRLRARCAASAALIALLGASGRGSAAPEEAPPVLANGTFKEGSAGIPAGWRKEAWDQSLSRFEWQQDDGTVSIVSQKPNDARWCHTIDVQPGASYRVAASVKVNDVGAATAGALIAVEPRITDTRDIRGTHDWQTIEVVANAGEETSWDICARLGSYASLNTGTAWFREVTVTQIGGTRPSAGVLARTWSALRPTTMPSWLSLVVPLAGGLLLAFGLGVFRRRD